MLIGEERSAGPFRWRSCHPGPVHYFHLLETYHKEYKGAVGIALLNYCACSYDVRSQNLLLIVPQALAPEHPFPKQLRQTIAAASTCWT